MAQADLPHAVASSPRPARGAGARLGRVLFLVVLVLFVGRQTRSLWNEWGRLQAEWSRVRRTAVVGYVNVSPRFSFARRPDEWFHHEGEYDYLWGGWVEGRGHHWFRLASGDLEARALSPPIGRDVFRAIDAPLVEIEGGSIWGRVPDEAPVVGLDWPGFARAYPLLVLDKVWVVNDTIDCRPILVTYDVFSPAERAVAFYEASLDGRRVTMGSSGVNAGRRHLFYDRDSESLWCREGEALRSVAGPLKGRSLRQVAQPAPISWRDWRGRHPGSRLLVGSGTNNTIRTIIASRVILAPPSFSASESTPAAEAH
jgi:hypothetical protein